MNSSVPPNNTRQPPISAVDDLEAVSKTAKPGPLDAYRVILRDGNRVVTGWPGREFGIKS